MTGTVAGRAVSLLLTPAGASKCSWSISATVPDDQMTGSWSGTPCGNSGGALVELKRL